MNKHLVGLTLAFGLTFATLDAFAQAQTDQMAAPPPPIANPVESPWGAPPPPPGALAPQPVYVTAQPAYAPQPVYGMSPRYGRARPLRIPYEGGPVPPGGRLETRARLGLAIGGGVTFGVTWLLTASVGALVAAVDDGFRSSGSSTAWWLVVPVLGPVGFGLALGDVRGEGWFFLGLDTIAQGAGLAMLLYGVMNPVTYVVYDGQARREAPARPRWTLLPGTAASPHGATFALTF